MSAESAPSGLAATLRDVPPPAESAPVRADDHGAFRAVDPVAGRSVVIRPTAEGLVTQCPSGTETVSWDDVVAVHLHTVEAHTMRVSAARIEVAGRPPIDIVRLHAAGNEYLPTSLTPGGPPLVRVERMRLLVAAVVARAGLNAVDDGVFARGPRLLPPVEIGSRPRILPAWAAPVLLVLSVIGLVWVFHLTLALALVVTVILFVHEYGHVLANRALGLRVRGIVFLPLLGAATVPEQAFPTRYAEARVALAGPMTGLPLSLAAIFAARFGWLDPELAGEAILWSLAVNFLNLIPVLPLDGGRVLVAMTAALPLRVRRAIQYVPLGLAVVLLLLFVHGAAGLAIGAFVVFAVVVTRLVFRRQVTHEWMEKSAIDLAALRAALRDITDVTSGLAREDVDGGVPPTPLRAAEVASVLVVYAVTSGSLLAVACAVSLWPHLVGLQ